MGGKPHVAPEKHTVGAGVTHVHVLVGAVFSEARRHPAPEIVAVTEGDVLEATVDSRIVLLPDA